MVPMKAVAKGRASKPAVAPPSPPPTAAPALVTSWPAVSAKGTGNVTAIPEIVDAVKHPEKHGGVAAACKVVIQKLTEQSLAKEMHFTPKQLGMHPVNRGGTGCNEEAVHQLAAQIFEVGWDAEKVSGGICVEEDDDRYIEAFNKKMTHESEYLAPVADRSIMAGTLTNGHTILMLRALEAGVKTSVQSIAVDGCMSAAHVAITRPKMVEALQGWRWTMLTKEVKHVYGTEILEFLSGVHNVSVNRKEHELEVLMKIFRLATASPTSIDWSEISRSILRTKPDAGEYLQSLIKFVQEYGGGTGSCFVEDLCRFYRKGIPGQRVVHGHFFEWVAAVKFVNKE